MWYTRQWCERWGTAAAPCCHQMSARTRGEFLRRSLNVVVPPERSLPYSAPGNRYVIPPSVTSDWDTENTLRHNWSDAKILALLNTTKLHVNIIIYLFRECCSRCRFPPYDCCVIILSMWSRFSLPSNVVNGHVSTMWFMVCHWPQSQEGDWTRPHLCKWTWHGPLPVPF